MAELDRLGANGALDGPGRRRLLRVLGTRSAGFFTALLLAATYFGTAAFKDVFFWFDSVSYGLLLLAMAASRPSLRAMAMFAACFSDERALLVAPLTLVR